MFSIILPLLLSLPSARAFTVAKGLTDADRRDVTRILGLNSANKLLSNPYPLGGFPGWELGYSVEVVDVRDLRQVGRADVTEESSWRYSRLTLGKGLYNNVDVFVSFVPATGGVPISDYGGILRWAIYQAAFLPINLSVLAHGNQMNFANRFSNRNIGVEAMLGVTLDEFAAYAGLGYIHGSGNFMGPDANGTCNDDCTVDDVSVINKISRSVSQDLSATRTVIGFTYSYDHLFAAAEVSRVDGAVFSAKLGVRF